ncbi:MAG: protein jag [Anaerolineae bacterium]|nr:protein jag [Anaerolineae bacterium]
MSNQNESLDVSAKTIDEAIEQGLAQLGLTREQVDVEIVKEGKRGVFGIGSEEAQVRLTRKRTTPAEAAPTTEIAEAEGIPAVETRATSKPVEPALPAPSEVEPTQPTEMGEIAAQFLTQLLKLMGIKAKVSYRLGTDLVEPGEAPPLVLDITGGDLGILIGRRSETLQALQDMVRLMVSKELSAWQPIVVDVESYRVRRRQSLRQMAEKMAERVVATRKKIVLEAMPAHERRIIHITLRDHPLVTTKSVGSDDNRKVTIIPK